MALKSAPRAYRHAFSQDGNGYLKLISVPFFDPGFMLAPEQSKSSYHQIIRLRLRSLALLALAAKVVGGSTSNKGPSVEFSEC